MVLCKDERHSFLWERGGMVDTLVLEASAVRCESSSLSVPTIQTRKKPDQVFLSRAFIILNRILSFMNPKT
jgi:hypothetical protein